MDHQYEIARVSNQVLAWLADPFCVPPDQPHCWYCNTPKRERNTRCEVCGQRNAVTGRQPERRNGAVYVERYTRKFVRVKKRRK